MPTPFALPALPGSSPDPGTGPAEPAALDGLLDDASALTGTPMAVALAFHRALVAGPHRDLLGPLLVPADRAQQFRDALQAEDLGLRVLLVADSAGGTVDPLATLREARGVLLDEDRIEVIGARLPLPPPADPELGARSLLAALDLSTPAWIVVPAGPGALAALEVLAADGAENVYLDLSSGDDSAIALALRRAVDVDLSFRVGASGAGLGVHRTGVSGIPGLLNLLCAVRAALNGAEEADLERVLQETAPPPLVSAMRRMSAADAAVARAFLIGAQTADPLTATDELAALGLLDTVTL
jgi:hypothetical protein